MRLWTAIAALALAAGCGGKDPSTGSTTTTGTSPTGTTASLVTSVSLDPAPTAAPLTRVLRVETTRPVRVEATLSDGTDSRTWRFAAEDTSHVIPLIGFTAGPDWTVTVDLVESDSTTTTLDPLTTDASLSPLHLPTYDVRTLDSARTEPGFTLINLRSRGNGQVSETWTLLDESLTPVWFQVQARGAKGVTQLADGTLIGLDSDIGVDGQWAVSRDLTGAVTQEWHSDATWPATGVHLNGTYALHHDLIELPNGNLAALAKEPDGYFIADYPASYTDSADRQADVRVNADRIVEFTRDGTVVRDLALGPLMDTSRIGYDSLDNSFLDGRLDWIHANGLDYDAATDAYVVSFRHQDAVVKIDAQSETVDWILANPDNWSAAHDALRLTGDVGTTWPYHQHSPDLSADGRSLLVFDNGNWQASPWTGQATIDLPENIRSRVVEYGIDPAAGTVAENWSFEPDGGRHSCPAVGGAAYLDNGNVLASFSLVIAVDGTLNSAVGLGEEAVRIVEFTPGSPHEVVADVFLSVPASLEPVGWQVFKAERIASPYGPGVLLD